ncbi:putative S-adenosyl-L-methionine-dependent methyltransferase [Tanacetum coccineum]
MEIECLLVRTPAASPPILRQSLLSLNNSNQRNKTTSLKVSGNKRDDDFQSAAISRASYRFQESLRPGWRGHLAGIELETSQYLLQALTTRSPLKPLFVDPYAGCFAPPNIELDKNIEQKQHHYCIGTRFIDDQLLSATKGVDGPKQVVLFTDGMDTRGYRLKWSSSTVIYDVSPQSVFKKASQKLQDVGAKIPRSCLLLHVPLESSDMEQLLRDKGFNGSRPSIWVFQGFPIANLAAFNEILFIASNLAMKGCLFLGELPAWLTETKMGIKPTVEKWMYELFMSYGFRVRIIGYDEVAGNLGQEQIVGDSDNVLFVAEHLRFSDDEMEIWRREFQRIEGEGDEEGFEEL